MKASEYAIEMKKGTQSNYDFVVTITPEQQEACHMAVLKEYQKEAVQPGFRKGHVPLAMVEKLANPATVFMATLEEIVRSALDQVISKHPDIRWIGQIYNIDTSKLQNKGENGTLGFSLDVFPEVVVKNNKWESTKVKPYSVEVSQKDIDTTVDQLRSSYATFDDVEKVTKTSLMRLKIAFLDSEGKVLGHEKNQYLGEEELSKVPALHKQFIGKKKGDTVTADYKTASEITLLKVSGDQNAETVSCEIIDIKQKILPELNQEFIDKTFTQEDNITSVDVLMEKIKETLQKSKEENALLEWVDNYLTSIDSSFELQLPKTLVEEELKNRLDHLGKQLGGEKGLKAYLDRLGEEEAKKYVDSIKEAAEISIHKYFILKYVTEELKLPIDWNKSHASGEVEQQLYDKLVK